MMSRGFIFVLILTFLRGSTGFQAENARDFVIAELIHRDSPMSPLYNSSKTSSEQLREAVARSLNQINRFNSSFHLGHEKAFESQLIPDNDDYLMNIFIGFKPLLVMASPGSVAPWILCKPCENCHPDVSLFDLYSNDKYEEIPLDSEDCKDLPDIHRAKSYMNLDKPMCGYRENGQSQIFSGAEFYLASNGRKVTFFPLLFGCCHDSKATLSPRVQGSAGLGHGDLSLISQLVKAFKIKKIYSYCLLPVKAESPSKIILGKRVKFTGKEVRIPFTTKESSPYYYLTLKHAQVGLQKTEELRKPDNMIIDSGTAITVLEMTLFDEIRTLVKRFISKPITIKDPITNPFSLCYEEIDMINGVYPNIILEFDGERRITLKPTNIFIKYNDDGLRLICMAIIPSNDGISVLGNLAQTEFQVEYNLEESFISFGSTIYCEDFGK